MRQYVDPPTASTSSPCDSVVRAPKWQIVLLLILNAACDSSGDGTASGLGVVVEDSAGVTIVTNAQPAPGSRLPWQFGAQPSLSIGSVESGGADELFRVQDATLLGDGRIVIANAGSGELRVFNADGSHSGTWGRQGEGPGEFTRGPSFVASWPGDSIAAPDFGKRRLLIFGLDGNHGRDLALDATRFGIVDLLPDGKIFTSGSLILNPDISGSPGLVRYYTEWAVLEPNGTLLVSLGEFPMFEEWAVEVEADGNVWETPHPFGRGTLGAVWGVLVAIGVQDSYEIKAFATDGSLVSIVRRGGESPSPTRAHQDEYFARLSAGRPAAQRAEALRSGRDMPLVDSYPAFEEILSDRAGYLWVREYRMFGEGDAVWTVFDSEGRIQGVVETPPGLEVFEIGEDYVLGLAQDELGVEHVQMWALDRGAG